MSEYIKEELISNLKPREITGQFEPDREKLHAPLEGEHSIGYAFCQGCGLTMEITQQGGELLQKEFGIEFSQETNKTYIHLSRCPACDTQFRNPEQRTLL